MKIDIYLFEQDKSIYLIAIFKVWKNILKSVYFASLYFCFSIFLYLKLSLKLTNIELLILIFFFYSNFIKIMENKYKIFYKGRDSLLIKNIH